MFCHSKSPFAAQTGRTGQAGRTATMADGPTAKTYGNTSMAFHVGGRGPANTDPTATNFTPGPGTYNATTGFDQHNKAMQSAKTLQEFGLDQFGI